MLEMKTAGAAIAIGLAYSIWPVMGKYLGLSGSWIATTVVFGTALAATTLSVGGLRTETIPSIHAITIILVFALINGVGAFMHGQKAADPVIQIGMFSAMIYLVQVIGAPLLDRMINGTQLSTRQIVAVALGATAVLLAQK